MALRRVWEDQNMSVYGVRARHGFTGLCDLGVIDQETAAGRNVVQFFLALKDNSKKNPTIVRGGYFRR